MDNHGIYREDGHSFDDYGVCRRCGCTESDTVQCSRPVRVSESDLAGYDLVDMFKLSDLGGNRGEEVE